MALAFGIGSGPVVSNVIASYYVRRMYRAGLNVRIGSIEGRVVEILPTTVALETAAGRVQVPCRKFLDDVSLLVRDS
jgi:small-conductance mechanosensitive channel